MCIGAGVEPSWLLCARTESPVETEALGRIATNGPLQLDFQRVDATARKSSSRILLRSLLQISHQFFSPTTSAD